MGDLTDTQAWQVATGTGGWLRFRRLRVVEGVFAEHDAPQSTIYLRVSKDATGQPAVRDAVMIGSSDPISAASWRDIPFDVARLYAIDLDDEGAPPMVIAPAEQLGADGLPFSLTDGLEALFADALMSGTLINRGAVAAGSLSGLKSPADGLTDEFLTQLSAAYRELVTAKRAPAPAIAEQAGRPVGTVHRWIGEARKRGFLPPAQRGKAG